MNKILSSLLILTLVCSSGYSQIVDTLRLQDFNDLVLNNHPLVKKANLFDELSQAYRLKGRGTFDPKASASFDRKDFKNTNYFNRWFTEIKVPTRYPIDLSFGYENNDGTYLNPEATSPNNGLLYGTLNISVLRGLIFDEQRYNLQAAELQGIKGQIEKEILLREIIIQSINAYIDWAAAYYNYLQYQEYEKTIINRHQNIVRLWKNGDIPAIDTIESRVNWNTAIKNRLNANNEYLTKTQKLNLFLWDDQNQPLTITDDLIPQKIENVINVLHNNQEIITPDWDKDPIIRKKDTDIQSYQLKNKLVREMYKPQLDLKLNTIYSPGENIENSSYNVNDYKIGARIEVPLMNRKTKGQLQLNQVSQMQIAFEKENYKAKFLNDYQMLLNSKDINDELILNAIEKIKYSQLLYDAEVLKYQIGESSVFLLNQRERKLLESKIEAIKYYKDLSLTLNKLYYIKLGQN